MSIIQGNNRYGNILSAAEKTCKMSRATFDKHLKQLQKDHYIKRKNNKKTIEYTINQKKVQEISRFKENEVIDRIIANNNMMLNSKGEILIRRDAEKHLEEILEHLNQNIMECLEKQKRITILMNLKEANITLKRKYKNELKKYALLFEQSLKIMEKLSPKIRENYEYFLLLKEFEKDRIELAQYGRLKGEALLKYFNEKKIN
ncbi:MAG: hypothetical protein ACW9W3_01110 [Candidatus Nitrosopumilus sp. bin_68KS]